MDKICCIGPGEGPSASVSDPVERECVPWAASPTRELLSRWVRGGASRPKISANIFDGLSEFIRICFRAEMYYFHSFDFVPISHPLNPPTPNVSGNYSGCKIVTLSFYLVVLCELTVAKNPK